MRTKIFFAIALLVVGWTLIAAAPSTSPSRQQWEYAEFVISRGCIWVEPGRTVEANEQLGSRDNFHDLYEKMGGKAENPGMLNFFLLVGKDGWELTAIDRVTEKKTINYFFKRPKQS